MASIWCTFQEQASISLGVASAELGCFTFKNSKNITRNSERVSVRDMLP